MFRGKVVGVVTGTIVVFTGLTVAGGRLNDSGWLLRSRNVTADKLTPLTAGHAGGSYMPETATVTPLDRISTRKSDLTPLSSEPIPLLAHAPGNSQNRDRDRGRDIDNDRDRDDRGGSPHDRLGSAGPHDLVGGGFVGGGGAGFAAGGGSKPGKGGSTPAPAPAATVSTASSASGGSSASGPSFSSGASNANSASASSGNSASVSAGSPGLPATLQVPKTAAASNATATLAPLALQAMDVSASGVASNPEPASILLLCTGVLTMAGMVRRRRQ
jgi:hypothetical protein